MSVGLTVRAEFARRLQRNEVLPLLRLSRVHIAQQVGRTAASWQSSTRPLEEANESVSRKPLHTVTAKAKGIILKRTQEALGITSAPPTASQLDPSFAHGLCASTRLTASVSFALAAAAGKKTYELPPQNDENGPIPAGKCLFKYRHWRTRTEKSPSHLSHGWAYSPKIHCPDTTCMDLASFGAT